MMVGENGIPATPDWHLVTEDRASAEAFLAIGQRAAQRRRVVHGLFLPDTIVLGEN